ncbi:ribbon-helix-helix protein, CopG family [Mesorhizobium sp. M3A.F.Ca.ET.080.04.2.1]|uniref:ribbon-helix-helix domain-containing protein n=1 Tax=Mesorhizobium sp. M3A.F.Ca.ET.080.04.2.1 TaxID=2493676 RepID=UPI000F7610BA|nr:CopG family transcriptional regulator [Mesorhizobium sp. M3A.F.Ca.ET.080.04.2.1]AZO07946.1 ribbon-helix-helix protein, CopG family [Mesorhizobium sp. M3A.F.Ca.ET.080.04.2.1]RWF18005.1 MAG: ribbon-helix-helix protein, CopG family [Mesorhizobium sp.]
MADNTDNMVLRTIYLSKDLDQTLKLAAIRGGCSKGELIRDLILTGLNEKRKDPQSYFVESKGEKKSVRPISPKAKIVAKGKSKPARKKAAVAA